MNSYERFEAACDHRTPDHVPIDLQIHPRAFASLLEYYDLANKAESMDRIGCDFYYLSARDISQNESCLTEFYLQLNQRAFEQLRGRIDV